MLQTHPVKQITPHGTILIHEQVKDSPLDCLLLRSSYGRFTGASQATGVLDILAEELFDRYQAWALAHGGYIGAQVTDDHFYYYLMLPGSAFQRLMPRLQRQLLECHLNEFEFDLCKRRLLARFKIQAAQRLVEHPGRPLVTAARGNDAATGSVDAQAAAFAALGFSDYQAMRAEVFEPQRLMVTYVGRQAAQPFLSQLTGALQELKGKPRQDSQTNFILAPTPRRLALVDHQTTLAVGIALPDMPFAAGARLLLLHNVWQMSPSNFVQSFIDRAPNSAYLTLTSNPQSENSLAENAGESTVQPVLQEMMQTLARPLADVTLLEAAKNIAERRFLEANEGLLGRSWTLSYFEANGGLETIDPFLASIRLTQAQDLNDLQKRLLEAPLDVMAIAKQPEHAESLVQATQLFFENRDRTLPTVQKSTPLGFPGVEPVCVEPYLISRTAPRASQNQTRGFDSFFTLNSGLQVLCLSDQRYPLDYFGAYTRGGRIFEGAPTSGITQLLFSSLLTSLHHPLQELSRQHTHGLTLGRAVDWLGGYVEADVTADISGLRGLVIERFTRTALDVITESLFVPNLPEPWLIEGVKQVQLERLESRERDLFHHSVDLFYQALYGIHPYGLSRFGVQESLEKLTQKDLYEWHRSWIQPSKTVLVILTSRPLQEVQSMLHQWHWPTISQGGKGMPAEILSLSQFAQKGEVIEVESTHGRRSACVVGFRVPPQRSAEKMARVHHVFDVLQHALTGPSGMIMAQQRRLHEDSIHRVQAFFVPLAKGGIVFLYLEFEGDKHAAVVPAMQALFQQIAERGLSRPQLKRAKQFAVGSHQIALQSPMHLIYETARSFLLRGESYVNQGYAESLRAVTNEDIQEVMRNTVQIHSPMTIFVRGGRANS